jgi:hypothetical protein
MIALRGLRSDVTSVVMLSIWLGAAIVVAAVVAPAAFAVLPTRTLAGALVGRVLPSLFWSGAVVGLVAALLARAQPHGNARRVSALALTLACVAAQLGVAPRIERVRASAGGPIDALPRADSRRVAFSRLHGVSIALLGAAAVAGATGIALTIRALPAHDAFERPSTPLHER